VAFGWVIWKVLQEWVSVTGGDLGISSIPKPQIGPLQLDTQIFYFFVLAFFLAALFLQERFMRSRFGVRLRAMRHSELGIASVGVDVHALKVVVFVVSAAFAGFGGTLFAHQQNYISPDNFQFFSSVFFLLAILFGGAGTRLGPIIGAAVLTILPELLHDFDKYRLIIYGCFILLTLYFLPNGVVGLIPAGRRSAGALSPTASSKPGPTLRGGLTAVRGASLGIAGVSRSFGGLRALSDVTFSVESGSIHALIGPNGAGKTTLINVASAIYKADMGRILIDGQPARFGNLHEAATQGLARTFQTIKLFGDMTVLEHVLIGLSQHSGISIWQELTNSRRARAQIERHIEEAHRLIHFVGLAGYEDRPATELAYGHRRLVEIARALATRPRLLLLDEPAAGLVAEEIVALAHVIRQLQQSGMTVLLVEHHMDLVVSVSDRITVLDQGMVIADGFPSAIQRDERVIAAYLGPSHVAA
jgi:ABC-type branched-subunit amino acid transport system ATPase component